MEYVTKWCVENELGINKAMRRTGVTKALKTTESSKREEVTERNKSVGLERSGCVEANLHWCTIGSTQPMVRAESERLLSIFLCPQLECVGLGVGFALRCSAFGLRSGGRRFWTFLGGMPNPSTEETEVIGKSMRSFRKRKFARLFRSCRSGPTFSCRSSEMMNQSRAEQMVSCAFYFDCSGCSGWKKRKTDCVVSQSFLRRLSNTFVSSFPHLVPVSASICWAKVRSAGSALSTSESAVGPTKFVYPDSCDHLGGYLRSSHPMRAGTSAIEW